MSTTGTIIKSTGKWYTVRTEQGELSCRIKGKFRLKDLKLTNPVAVGDHVEIELEENQPTGIITKLLDRKNYVLRRSPHKRHHMHLIAANLDQVWLIVTIRFPYLKSGFIDRFLLTTESHNIPTHIIVNKADLYNEDDLDLFEGLKYVYEKVGCHVHLVSALEGTGVEELRALLKDKTTLVSGHSGVGKSSLINALSPQLDLVTGEVSDYSQKGMHTTTFAEMFYLEKAEGNLIDTPGIKEFGFINMTPQDVAHNFAEIFEYSSNCKYSNCMHLNEPHCAVKAAVESGEINLLRYQSYCSILEEVQEQKHWERQTKW